MANPYTLTALDRFPAGTAVGAYPATGYLQSQLPPSGAPPMAASETQTMGATGATFTTLADGTYYFGASISGTWRFVSGKVSGASAAPVLGGETISDIDVAAGADIASSKLHDGASIPTAGQKAALAGALPPSATARYQSVLFPTGGDDSAALQAYLDTSPFAVGIVDITLGPGTFLWNTAVVKLPRSAVGIRIRGSGIGLTTIKLSSSAPRAFDFNKIADHDLFSAISLSDFTVDANSITGAHHVVLGTLQAGTFQSRISLTNIDLRRIRTINVATDSNNTADRRNVSFVVRHPADDEATQDTITHITCEDLDFLQGGSYGIQWGGTSPGNSTNVFCDDIQLNRCKHDTGVTYTANHGGANFFGPSGGYGRSVRIFNCYGAHSGDVGVEVDAHTDAVVDGTVIRDAFDSNFFCRNFHVPEYGTAQRQVFQNCVALVIDLNPTSTGSQSHGFQVGHPTAPTPALGHVIVDNCEFISRATNMAVTGTAFYSNSVPVERLTVKDFTASLENVNYTPDANKFGELGKIFLTGTSEVTLRNVTIKHAGTVSNSGGFTAEAGGFKVSPASAGTMKLTVDGFHIWGTLTGTGAVVGQKLRVGNGSGTMRFVLRGVSTEALTAAPAFGGDMIYVDGSGTLTLAAFGGVIEDCDFSKINGTTNNAITFADATNRAKVRVESSNVLHLGSYASSTYPNVASSATVTLPHSGDSFSITGTTNITSITASWAERLVSLRFAGALTFTDGSNLKLDGDFPTAADATILLSCDGTNWREVARSLN